MHNYVHHQARCLKVLQLSEYHLVLQLEAHLPVSAGELQSAAWVLPEDLAGHTWAGLSAVALQAQLVKMMGHVDATPDAAVR